MSALLALSALLLAPMLAVALLNLATATRLESAPRAGAGRRVSVLVPARDEEANLRALLPLLLAQDHPDLEVLVLDDHSSDGTAARVRRLRRADGRLRLLTGAPLPPGWLGKSWACRQLAAAATGDVLLFCDADVRPAPDAVSRTAGLMEARGAGAATAVLHQEVRGWAERAVVPLVTQVAPLALLPLRLVERIAAPSVALGNGQWLAFTRAAYARSGGHAAVRGRVAEDLALARALKRSGERLVVAVASRSLRVRMYHGAAEVREGFAKNLYELLGRRAPLLLLALALWTLVAVLPWLAALARVPGAAPPLAALLGVRLCGMALFRQDWKEVALHPLGAVALLGLALESRWRGAGTGVRWKGRPVAPTAPGASPP